MNNLHDEIYDYDFDEIVKFFTKNPHYTNPKEFVKVLHVRPDIYAWCNFINQPDYLKKVLDADATVLKKLLPYIPVAQRTCSNLYDAVTYDNIHLIPKESPCFDDISFCEKAVSLGYAPDNKAFYLSITDPQLATMAIEVSRNEKYIPLNQRKYHRHTPIDEGITRPMYGSFGQELKEDPNVLYAMCSRLASFLTANDEHWLSHALQHEKCVTCLIQNGIRVAHQVLLICPDTEHTLMLGALGRKDAFQPELLTDEFNEDQMAKVYAILDSQGFQYPHEYHTHPHYLSNYQTQHNQPDEIDILF